MDTEKSNELIAIVDDDDLMRNALQGSAEVCWIAGPGVCFSGGISAIRTTAPDGVSDRRHPHAGNVRSGIAGQAER